MSALAFKSFRIGRLEEDGEVVYGLHVDGSLWRLGADSKTWKCISEEAPADLSGQGRRNLTALVDSVRAVLSEVHAYSTTGTQPVSSHNLNVLANALAVVMIDMEQPR